MYSQFLRREVGPRIAELSIPSVEPDESRITQKEFKELSSYNWIESSTPTIMVPGAPAKWTPKPLPIRIQQDRGLAYIDQNRYRHPTFPLEPLFRSIYAVNQAFDPKPIHFVTDRNNLRKLMFVVSNIRIDNFRVEIEIVGDTMLFTRCEPSASEIITEFRGFGHEFEKVFTKHTASMSGSTGHHRVVQYNLGKLTMIVRFEVDGYMEERATAPKKDADIDDLTSSLRLMELNQSTTMKVIRNGQKISHESLLELKTRAKHRPLQNSDVIYQLWFSRVSNLIVGYHMRGVFSNITQKNFVTEGQFETFEKDKWRDILKLVAVIEKIKETLKKAQKKRAVLLYENHSLSLYERTGNAHALPKDLLLKWG